MVEREAECAELEEKSTRREQLAQLDADNALAVTCSEVVLYAETEVGPYRWQTHTLTVLDCV